MLIQDVIDALGPRDPSTNDAPRLHRQAFVYMIRRGSEPSQADLTKLGRDHPAALIAGRAADVQLAAAVDRVASWSIG